MSQTQRTALLTIAGVLAGVLIWYTLDKSTFLVAVTFGQKAGNGSMRSANIVGALLGGVFGLLLGTADALTATTFADRAKRFAAAFALGIVAGVCAMHVSRIAPSEPVIALAVPVIAHSAKHAERPIPIGSVARDFAAWCLLGALVGAAQGVGRRSWRLALQGALGGALGGLLGGAMMPHRRDDSNYHIMSVFGFALTGGGIGLLSSWLPNWLSKGAKDGERANASASVTNAAGATVPTARLAPAEKRGEFSRHDLHAAPAVLICIAGPYDGERFVVPPGTDVSIGRGTDQDIAIVNDSAASRAHASVCVRDGKHVVIDNGSANGTFLNEGVVTSVPRRLFQGDVIRVGRSEFRYESTEPLPSDNQK
jgi:pSer/pThr/pTyr-binding forkhead associated (FHA) protein